MGSEIYVAAIIVILTIGATFASLKAASTAVKEATGKPLEKVTFIFWMAVSGLVQFIITTVKFHPAIYLLGLIVVLGMMVLTIRPPKDEVWEDPLYRFISWIILSAVLAVCLCWSASIRSDGWNAGIALNIFLYGIFPLFIEAVVGGLLTAYCSGKRPKKPESEQKKEDNTPDAVPASAA